MVQYLEDLAVGEVGQIGTYRMTEGEIREFVSQYNSLPIRTDEAAASRSPHNGLIASGFHTFSAVNSVVTEEFKSNLAVVAGLGIDDLRWYSAVASGDILRVALEIVEARQSKNDPNQGIYRLQVTATDQHGNHAISYVDSGLVRTRNQDEA